MNTYSEMKNRHQQEFNGFPMMFAFSDKQFEEGMAKLGLSPNDTDKVYSYGNTGGFCLRSDAPRLHEIMAGHNKEMQDAIGGDTTGEGFILEMFDYELANHEYVVTHGVEETLDALDLTFDDIKKDKRLKRGLELAKKRQLKKYEEEV